MFFDPVYILLILPALLLAIWAQVKVKGSYGKFSRVPLRSGLSGAQVAQQILQSFNLFEVRIEQVPGNLTDHYDPRTKVLRLSPGVYQGRSIASAGIAAHEVGHAIQHGQGYFPLHLRSAIYPMTALGSNLAMPLFIIGFIFSALPLGRGMMMLGVLLFTFSVFFTLVTLPVEFNASSRALHALEGFGYLAPDEMRGARKVLSAAALTYVAAAAMAILQLVYMFLRARR